MEDICCDFNDDNDDILADPDQLKIRWLEDRTGIRIAAFADSARKLQ